MANGILIRKVQEKRAIYQAIVDTLRKVARKEPLTGREEFLLKKVPLTSSKLDILWERANKKLNPEEIERLAQMMQPVKARTIKEEAEVGRQQEFFARKAKLSLPKYQQIKKKR